MKDPSKINVLVACEESQRVCMAFYNAPIPHVAIENPVPTGMWHLPGYSQIIQPYYFGDPYTKRTCLWLWDLPELKPTDMVKPIGAWVQGGKKSGNGGYTKGVSHRSPKIRAKTFPGIAKAMAEQCGDYLMEVNNNAL